MYHAYTTTRVCILYHHSCMYHAYTCTQVFLTHIQQIPNIQHIPHIQHTPRIQHIPHTLSPSKGPVQCPILFPGAVFFFGQFLFCFGRSACPEPVGVLFPPARPKAPCQCPNSFLSSPQFHRIRRDFSPYGSGARVG